MNLQYEVLQKIVETENKINLLCGRLPGKIPRSHETYFSALGDSLMTGVPSQLLHNRPDILQAEHLLESTKLDILVARAAFFPSIRLSANIGLQAFNPSVWFKPASVFYSLLGDVVSPLINQNVLNANYNQSCSKQIQAVLNYEQTVIRAFTEVQTQLAGIKNYSQSLDVKSREVDILATSVAISENLFRNARADYLEILLTQREVLDSKLEQTDIRLNQLMAKVKLYKALGGGWQ